MGNYTELQARVNRRVIDLPTAVTAEVPLLINEALAKLQEEHNFKFMEAEISAFTQANSHILLDGINGAAINTSNQGAFKEFRGEPWFLTYQDGNARFMSWAPSKEALWGRYSQGGAVVSDGGAPQVLLENISDANNNRTFSVYPMPAGSSDYPDGEYRITIPVVVYIGSLVAGADHNWFTDQSSGEQYILHWATAQAFALNWDYQKMAVHEKLAEIHRRDLIKADKKYRLGAVREFVPHWQGVHSNKTRI